jgi:hypothetical protein
MHNPSLLGPWVRRFLMEHMVSERNLTRNTQRSYRDALQLLLPAIARRARKPLDRLAQRHCAAVLRGPGVCVSAPSKRRKLRGYKEEKNKDGSEGPTQWNRDQVEPPERFNWPVVRLCEHSFMSTREVGIF